MNAIYERSAVTCMKYLISVVSLIFLPKFLIWNKIAFWLSNSLNLAELVVNELTKNISKKFTNIPVLPDLSLLTIKIPGAYN